MKHSEEFERITEEAKKNIKEVTIEDTKQKMKEGAILIDVREDNEWQKGHAQGAKHLGRGIIERDIIEEVPDKNTELILYCGGGYRSALAAENLQKMGYTNVYSMAGGWREWNEKREPTEK